MLQYDSIAKWFLVNKENFCYTMMGKNMTTYIFLSDFIKKNYPKEIINQLLAEILKK